MDEKKAPIRVNVDNRIAVVYEKLRNGGALLSAAELAEIATKKVPGFRHMGVPMAHKVRRAFVMGFHDTLDTKELHKALRTAPRTRMSEETVLARMRDYVAEKNPSQLEPQETNLAAVQQDGQQQEESKRGKAPHGMKALLQELGIAMKVQNWGKLVITRKDNGEFDCQPTPGMPDPLPPFTISP